MTRAIGLASSDGLAYAYTGQNAYAYSGPNAYAYSGGGGGEAYGFSGFPGNPMLGAGINATRAALAARVPFDPHNTAITALAAQNDPPAIRRYGGQVRSSMALFDLMSGLAFESVQPPNGTRIARLWAPTGAQGQQVAVLAEMTRPSFEYFRHQVVLVDGWAARRDIRVPEILTQVAPPIAYFASVVNLQADRARRTLEFVNVALQLTYAVCMRFKHALAVARPSELSAGVQAMIEVPMHAAMPSGHATEGHVTAALLGVLVGADEASSMDETLRRVAHRIAENRVVAGLHYPADNIAGRLLGDAIANYVLALVGHGTTWRGGRYDGASRQDDHGRSDRPGEESAEICARLQGWGCEQLAPTAAPPAPSVLQQMWADAAAEWN